MGFNQVADALGHQDRRQILVELLDHNPVAEGSARASEGSDIVLAHAHLPKLDDMGYIDWDREDETIVKGENWDEIEPVIRLLSDNRERIPSDTF